MFFNTYLIENMSLVQEHTHICLILISARIQTVKTCSLFCCHFLLKMQFYIPLSMQRFICSCQVAMTTASAEEFRLQASSLEWGDHIYQIRNFGGKIMGKEIGEEANLVAKAFYVWAVSHEKNEKKPDDKKDSIIGNKCFLILMVF